MKELALGMHLFCALLFQACASTQAQHDKATMSSMTNARSKISLHFDESGKGATMLFLHGFGANLDTWKYVRPSLSSSHRTIALDLKGFGKSPKPEDEDYSLSDQADLVLEFLRNNDLRNIILVGHSMGGGIALQVYLKLLDKGEKYRVARLILLDSVAYRQEIPSFINTLRTPILNTLALHLVSAEAQVQIVMREAFHNDSLIPKDLVMSYAQSLRQPGGRHALVKTAHKIIPDGIDALAARYAEISIPTLMIWGKQDQIVPLAVGNKLHETLPKSSLVVLDGCGHSPQEEAPDRTLKTIEKFLNERE